MTWRDEILGPDGQVRLICGDCREVLPTLGRVDACVTDPPYGTGCAPRVDVSWIDDLPHAAIVALCHSATAPALGARMRSDGLLIYVKSNPSPFGTSIEACVTRGIDRRSPQHIEAYMLIRLAHTPDLFIEAPKAKPVQEAMKL